jgi:hypothetical protein
MSLHEAELDREKAQIIEASLERGSMTLPLRPHHLNRSQCAESGLLMEPMRQEINEFSRISEKLLNYEVKPEELTTMERDVIQYYLSAIAEKFLVYIPN